MNFDDKVVIVTGAARGLGQEYARQFARLGASVAVNDLRDCSETLDIIEREGSAGIATTTDVTSNSSTREMAESVIERFGRIDVLINNAALYGSLTFAPFDQLDETEWDAAMNVNVKGIWQCCKAVLPAMKQQNGGSIVNITSLAAVYGMPNGLHYTASKAAVIQDDPDGNPSFFFVVFFQPKRSRVHAIAKTRRRGSIREDMTQMGVALGADRFPANHALAAVYVLGDGALINRGKEARPAGSGIVF